MGVEEYVTDRLSFISDDVRQSQGCVRAVVEHVELTESVDLALEEVSFCHLS